jgi:hypothetical protein
VAACRRIGYRESGSSPSIALESVDQRNSEAPFELSPGSQHQVISSERVKGGQPLYNRKYYLGRPSEGRAARIHVMTTFGNSSGKHSSPFYISKPRTPIAKAETRAHSITGLVQSRQISGEHVATVRPSRHFAHRDFKGEKS